MSDEQESKEQQTEAKPTDDERAARIAAAKAKAEALKAAKAAGAKPEDDPERAARVAAAKARAAAAKAAREAGLDPVAAGQAVKAGAEAKATEGAAAPGRKAPPKKKAEAPQEPVTPEAWKGYEEKILQAFPHLQREAQTVGALGFTVPKEKLHDTVAGLRELPGVATNYLSSVSAVDWKTSLEVAYHLFNLDDPQVRVVLKVSLDREAPEVESITDLFEGANWQEREVYDLFGVRFSGHPDLRRILMPEHFTGGHPLRKDYKDQRPKRERKVRPR